MTSPENTEEKRRCGVHDRRSLHEPSTHGYDRLVNGEIVHTEIPIRCSCPSTDECAS